MCGRFSRTVPLEVLLKRFMIEIANVQLLLPRFNVAPSQSVPVVVQRERRELVEMQWGLVPSWAKGPVPGPINARAEGLVERPMFRQLLARRRCLVPADGFYEWQVVKEKKRKMPLRFVLPEGGVFAFAGLWDAWRRPDGTLLHSFVIITTASNDAVRPVHDRMPVILRPEDEAIWLDPNVQEASRVLPLLVPWGAAMDSYPVSPKVNAASVDTPECVERFDPARVTGDDGHG